MPGKIFNCYVFRSIRPLIPTQSTTFYNIKRERLEGEVKEFKMTLQCQGMKIDGVTREKIEGKKLRELIDKAAEVEGV